MIKNKNDYEQFSTLPQEDSIKETLLTNLKTVYEHEKEEITIEMRSVHETDKDHIKSNYRGINKRTTVLLKTVYEKDDDEDHELIDIQEIKSQFKAESKKYQEEEQENYDIWDLTYTIISSKVPIMVSGILFLFFVLIRYYTLASIIYISTQATGANVYWFLVIVGNRLIYIILVIKISLRIPETRTEIVLKSHWNSKEYTVNELFEVTDLRKLSISFCRAIVPAELAFVYIKAQPRKKFELYTAINFINSSIEAVLYYPFFIAYSSILVSSGVEFGLDYYYKNSTLALVVLGEIITIVVMIVLVLVGVKRKYGNVFWCCK